MQHKSVAQLIDGQLKRAIAAVQQALALAESDDSPLSFVQTRLFQERGEAIGQELEKLAFVTAEAARRPT